MRISVARFSLISRFFRVSLYAAWMLAVGAAAYAQESSTQATQSLQSTQATRITIAAVGDLMCHESEFLAARQKDGGYNFESFFAAIAPLLSQADVAIGNLETVMAGAKARFTGYPAFNTPDEYATALKNAGFDVLTTANNHSFDRGFAGVVRTLDILDTLAMPHTGTSRSLIERSKPLMLDIKGIKLGILAYAYGLNQKHAPAKYRTVVNVIDTSAILLDIAEMEALPPTQKPDKIIVCLHWGDEYQLEPNSTQKKLAIWLFERGVDIILGSHPHVVQTVERKYVTRKSGDSADCVVIYSMGNFISGQRPIPRETGVIVWLDFEKNATTNAVSIGATAFTPTYIHKTRVDGKSSFVVLPVPDALKECEANPDYLPQPVKERLGDALKEITRQFATPNKTFKLYQPVQSEHPR